MTEPPKQDEALSYSAAAAELDSILNEIEAGTVDIDVLSQRVERAALLIKLCREKLAGSEMRITKVVEDLVADQGAAGSTSEPE